MYIFYCSIAAADLLQDSVSADLAMVDLPDRHFVIVDSVGQHFICCVSVIDLDPKRFDKIPFYLAEDRAVVDSYSKLASL